MELNSNNLNIRYNNALQKKRLQGKTSAPSFKGVSEIIDDVANLGKKKVLPKAKDSASSALQKAVSTVGDFLKRNIVKGTDSTYEYSDEIMGYLRKNFGSTFDECLQNAAGYTEQLAKKAASSDSFFNKAATFNNNAFKCIVDKENNTITFHKNSFARNILDGFKDFTGGMFLDACISIRNGFRKHISKQTPKTVSKFGQLLDNRIAKQKALDSFYKLSGAFESANEGLSTVVAKNAELAKDAMEEKKLKFIKSNVSKLAGDSVEAATRKVGQYNTKTERAFNRIATGFVSAVFASNDFYNISMLQKNDKNEANASGHKRFLQDMRRQLITATLTFVVLGAFQNKVNKSMHFATLSLGGVTLASEILSRKLGGIPLKPLSTEEAIKQGEKQKRKKEKLAFKKGKEQKENNEVKESTLLVNKTSQSSIFPSSMTMPLGYSETLADNNKNVFDVITNKQVAPENKTTSFTSNEENKTDNKKTEESNNGKSGKSSVLSTILKIFGGMVAASLAVGFLRSKNVLNIDTIIKSISKKYNNVLDKLKSKRLILPQEQVDDFMTYLKKSGYNKQCAKLWGVLHNLNGNGLLNDTSELVRKYAKPEDIKKGAKFYDMGRVETNFRKGVVSFLTYPVTAISKVVKIVNAAGKVLFVRESGAAKAKLSDDVAASFIKTYSGKYKDAIAKGKTDEFNKEIQNIFSRHFSEASSKNKNTSVALMSRFLITFISGYFFVNDYRNEVLIESKGKDVERANATAKERVGHKISNFLFNSMFMDLFNTTFENIYLKSLAGATGVAMMTEITNESAVRASICTPKRRMNKEQLIEYENKRMNNKGPMGKYYRFFMKLTGKKPLSQKANKKK